MPKLNDTQTIILSAASQRDDGSVFPLPDRLASGGARVAKALAAVLAAAMVAERETLESASIHRTAGDISFGLFITPAGLQAIGVEVDGDGGVIPQADVPSAAPVVRTSKIAGVLALLGRAEGATLAELVLDTGWLPHTTRAALTGLRKKGHVLERGSRDGTTCYRIVSAQ